MHTRTLQTFFCIFRGRDEGRYFCTCTTALHPWYYLISTHAARLHFAQKRRPFFPAICINKNYIPLSASRSAPTDSFSFSVRFWMPRGRVRLSRRQTAERNAKKSPGGFLCMIYIIYGMYQTCGGRGVIEHQILLKYEHVQRA
jgi:hypothetical protein